MLTLLSVIWIRIRVWLEFRGLLYLTVSGSVFRIRIQIHALRKAIKRAVVPGYRNFFCNINQIIFYFFRRWRENYAGFKAKPKIKTMRITFLWWAPGHGCTTCSLHQWPRVPSHCTTKNTKNYKLRAVNALTDFLPKKKPAFEGIKKIDTSMMTPCLLRTRTKRAFFVIYLNHAMSPSCSNFLIMLELPHHVRTSTTRLTLTWRHALWGGPLCRWWPDSERNPWPQTPRFQAYPAHKLSLSKDDI